MHVPLSRCNILHAWKIAEKFEIIGMVAQIDQGGMYIRLKELQRQLEILEIQEEYIRDETKNLKREMIRAKVWIFIDCKFSFL